MLDFLLVFLFCWLFFKAIGLAFKMAWGTTKVIVSLLLALAVPLLGGILVFAGGLLLLIPIAILGIAFAIVKACV